MKNDDIYIGIDIGGTNTVVGLVTNSGEMINNIIFPTFADKPINIFQESLEKNIHLLIANKNNNIKGIGIGMPGANSENGLIDSPVNFKWGNVNLTKIIQDQYKLPVSVINDANAAALGELKYGHAVDLENFIQLTLGTGLGSSFVADKTIIKGFNGFAGELGHTKVSKKERICKCGNRGCLETYVSASGVCRTVFELICNEKKYSPLMDYSYSNLTSKIVSEWASKGDEIAIKAYSVTGQVLGEKLADLITIFNPQAILLSGGLVAAGKYLFKPMEKAMNANVLVSHKNKTQIRISDSKVNYAVLGAASLVMNDKEY